MNYPPRQLWPVMLTPFTDTGAVDYNGLRSLIEWYEAGGADGLFAICQSSEMFFLSLRERVELAAFIKKHAKIPVIASGHISFSPEDQADELMRMADTGADALIMITNRLAQQGESEEIWLHNLEKLLSALKTDLPLGFYECPYPYKRLLSDRELAFSASTGRFKFMKDTCCDIDMIRRRLGVLAGSGLELYNANTSTLLDSLRAGAAGFSGVMASFHPELYAWLLKNWETEPEKAEIVQSVLSVCSQIEKQLYPINAKYHLSEIVKLPMGIYTRSKTHMDLSPLFRDEVRQMNRMVAWVKEMLSI